MSKFEVGDRVRLITKSRPPTTSAQIHVGEELTFYRLTNTRNAIVKHDESGTWCVNADDLELISKGESSMDNLEAIAVTGDKDLRKTLIGIAKEHGFYGADGAGGTFNGFYRSKEHITKSNLSNPNDSTTNFTDVSEDKRAVLDLPQDWEQAKKFITQEIEEPLTIGDYDVDIHDDMVKVGCRTFNREEALAVRDFLRAATSDDAPDLSLEEWEEIGEEILDRMGNC